MNWIKSLIAAALALGWATASHGARASLDDYWNGNAHFAVQATTTHQGGGSQITAGPDGSFYYVHSHDTNNPNCQFGHESRIHILKSVDEGRTWGDEANEKVLVGTGAAGSGYECGATDGTMTIHWTGATYYWDFLYQCRPPLATSPNWFLCYSRSNGPDPMGSWTHYGWTMNASAAGAAVCNQSGTQCKADLASRPHGVPAAPMGDCGTPDVVGSLGGDGVAISFHCFNGTMGARFMARTNNNFAGVSILNNDAFLSPTKVDAWQGKMSGYGKGWDGWSNAAGDALASGTAGHSAGVGHASTIQDGGYFYTIFEAMDYKTSPPGGWLQQEANQTWAIGLVRTPTNDLASLNWSSNHSHGNPILSNKSGIAKGLKALYPSYVRLFKDYRSPANVYFVANFAGTIKIMRLVAGAGGDALGGFDDTQRINTVKQDEEAPACAVLVNAAYKLYFGRGPFAGDETTNAMANCPNPYAYIRSLVSWYQIVNSATGKCLVVGNAYGHDYAPIVQQDCSFYDGPAERWSIRNYGANFSQITSELTGKCLTVWGSWNVGDPVFQLNCEMNWATQWWYRVSFYPTLDHIQNYYTGMSLRASGGYDYTPVDMWQLNRYDAVQRWQFQPVP